MGCGATTGNVVAPEASKPKAKNSEPGAGPATAWAEAPPAAAKGTASAAKAKQPPVAAAAAGSGSGAQASPPATATAAATLPAEAIAPARRPSGAVAVAAPVAAGEGGGGNSGEEPRPVAMDSPLSDAEVISEGKFRPGSGGERAEAVGEGKLRPASGGGGRRAKAPSPSTEASTPPRPWTGKSLASLESEQDLVDLYDEREESVDRAVLTEIESMMVDMQSGLMDVKGSKAAGAALAAKAAKKEEPAAPGRHGERMTTDDELIMEEILDDLAVATNVSVA